MFLGIDLGTGSVKALLVDESGRAVGHASRTYGLHSPAPGWAETDPSDWWAQAASAVRECCNGHAGRVMGIGLSGQAHGVVLCDGEAMPLRPAILWPDTRSRWETHAFAKLPDELRLRLANPPATGMAGPSLLWLKRHEPTVLGHARHALAAKDWLRLRLTGRAGSEPSDASMTLLYDMIEDCWAREVMERLDLDASLLPPLKGSTRVGGNLLPGAAAELGLSAGIPVAMGAADSAACLLGMGRILPGDAVLQVGSGIQIMSVCEDIAPLRDPPYHTFRTCTESRYRMAAMQNGGTAFEWARRALQASWADLYDAAFAAEEGSAGVIFLPHVTGERTPHMNPDAAGGWINLRLGCERAHLIRAVFEGVAFSVRDGWEALRDAGTDADQLILAGGGSSDPRWRQLLADVLRIPLRAGRGTGDAALGAAFLGGIAAGHWADIEALPFPDVGDEIIEPRAPGVLEERYAAFREAYRNLNEPA